MSSKNKKTKKNKFVLPKKVLVHSAYQLTQQELDQLRNRFSIIGDKEMENIVDPNIFAGVIIQSGTQRIDMSLSNGLQNLKNYIYERN